MRYVVSVLLYVLLGIFCQQDNVTLAAVLDGKEMSDNKRLRVHSTNAVENNAGETRLLESITLDDRERGFLSGFTDSLARLKSEHESSATIKKLVNEALKREAAEIEALKIKAVEMGTLKSEAVTSEAVKSEVINNLLNEFYRRKWTPDDIRTAFNIPRNNAKLQKLWTTNNGKDAMKLMRRMTIMRWYNAFYKDMKKFHPVSSRFNV